MSISSWPLALALLVACIAAFTDLRTRTIPNWLTLPLIPIALLVHGLEQGASASVASLVGALICLTPSLFLFARGALGGGDVKLFAAFGALLGARDGLELELTAFVLVTLFALWTSAWNGRLWALITASGQATLHLVAPARFARPEHAQANTTELPMGGAILCGMAALCLRGILS